MKGYSYYIILVLLSFSIQAKAQYNDSFYIGKTLVNTYKSHGYIFDQWVQYHIKGNEISIYRNTYPESWHHANIIIPDSVKYKNKTYNITGILENAWFEATWVRSFHLPDGIIEIPYQAFRDCFSVTQINIPKKCKRIGEWAFSRTAIDSVIVNDGMRRINSYAFYECTHLHYVELPATLEYLGEKVFNGCGNLDTVKVHFTEPIPIKRTTFFNTKPERKITLVVPIGTTDKFKNAVGWSLFNPIIEM